MIYAKICTNLRYFGLRFTRKSTQAKTRTIGRMRFSRRNFGPIRPYKIDLWFTLKLVTIYAALVHVLHWNTSEPEHAPIRRGGIPGWGFSVQTHTHNLLSQ
jgi:hypothetical protein